MKKLTIDTNNSSQPSFIVSGDLDNILNNKRLILSFKRLEYHKEDNKLLIPYRKENKIYILQELVGILKKFNFEINYSQQAQNDFSNYDREEKLFDIFSHKAEAIRNNKFDLYPELTNDFNAFQSILKESLIRTLYPLQLLSAFHLAFAQNGCNFAVPGAGKTSIVYGAYTYLKSLPADDLKHVDKLMIIGPLSSFAPWINEYQSCYGYRPNVQRLSGDINISREDKLEHLFSGNPSELTLIFHGGIISLKSEIIDFLKRHKTMVVVDEAHRIKNPEGVWGRSITEISKEATARVILTGTPVPNGYEDIYNLYKFIYPFRYKEIVGFHYQNLQELTKDHQENKIQELKSNIAPFFIRIKKHDLNLPPISENVIPVAMNTLQREIYNYIENEYIVSFQKNPSATVKDILNRAKLIRLRQASTNPSLLLRPLIESLETGEDSFESDPNTALLYYSDENFNDSDFFYKIAKYANYEIPRKFEIALELIRKILSINTEKVIIWTIFIQNAKELQTYLSSNQISSKLLIGEITTDERESTIEQFNNPLSMDFNVIIANPFSVAESISLHKGCHNAIYLERDYNASNFLQSKDRIHRVGLNKGIITNYYYLVATTSIDEVIHHCLKEKIDRMEKIVNDDIPLFSLIDDLDETDVIKELIRNYAQRT